MLERLELRDVGPAPAMRLDLAPRLNVFAGDNGLGKTFVLDTAWFTHTNTWPGYPAVPHRGPGVAPVIEGVLCDGTERSQFHSQFIFGDQGWSSEWERSWNRSLVVYARVDGGFSIWDRTRSAGKPRLPFGSEALLVSSAFNFNADQVWDGLVIDDHDKTVVCNGLIRDWVTWQLRRGSAFDLLTRVLEGLSARPGETIRPGASTTRISLHDVRDIPTIALPWGTIPVLLASAGMKRILSLAYLLVWMWREHVEAAKLKNASPSRSLLFLFDEVETHLHPQWQRVMLPALLRVIAELDPEIEVQVLFHFDLEAGKVEVEKLPWSPKGDASAWLVSDAFELGQARSLEAERAIEAAKIALAQPNLPIEEIKRIHHELRAVLKDTDPFWVRWLVRAHQAGVDP